MKGVSQTSDFGRICSITGTAFLSSITMFLNHQLQLIHSLMQPLILVFGGGGGNQETGLQKNGMQIFPLLNLNSLLTSLYELYLIVVASILWGSVSLDT